LIRQDQTLMLNPVVLPLPCRIDKRNWFNARAD
jgi:hypothetical protein